MTATLRAVSSRDWRDAASCRGIDDKELFSDRPTVQTKMQRICGRCPVRARCLTNAINLEADDYMVWHVMGGLTETQRRALRVEAMLGNQPNLQQAQKLTLPVFAPFMKAWRNWPAERVAAELRRHQILATPVTVRVALWWTGGRGSLLPPRQPGDRRVTWEIVRDEYQETVEQLRGMGVFAPDVAAYLGVARDSLEKATRSWRAATGEGVRAA